MSASNDGLHLDKEFREKIDYCQKNLHSQAKKLADELCEGLSAIYTLFENCSFIAEDSELSLNHAYLKRAATAFFEDLIRIRSYHPIIELDGHKKAGYLFKWINKFRPISITSEGHPLDAYELNVNGLYSIICAFSVLEKKIDFGLFTTQELDNMLYTAMFRDIHPDEWAVIFYFYEKIHPYESSDLFQYVEKQVNKIKPVIEKIRAASKRPKENG